MSWARRRPCRPSAVSCRSAKCTGSATVWAAPCWPPALPHSLATATRAQSFHCSLPKWILPKPGSLRLFIGESQVAFLEDMMWEQGYLEAGQMAGAFQLLRSNDLIWSRLMHSYLMGERPPTFDLLAWNADATRMPCRMHSEYLAQTVSAERFGRRPVSVGGHPVDCSDIRVPCLLVGTETDHVAPWRSVFKCHLLMDTDVAFVLTSGGHNAGIVSETERTDRHYRHGHKRERIDTSTRTLGMRILRRALDRGGRLGRVAFATFRQTGRATDMGRPTKACRYSLGSRQLCARKMSSPYPAPGRSTGQLACAEPIQGRICVA